MRPMRIPLGLLAALSLAGVPAQAAPADPYVIYTANREVAGPAILRADPGTGALTEVSRNGSQGNLFVHPYDLAVERDGSLVVADMGDFAVGRSERVPDGAVVRVDPATGNQTLVSRGGTLVDPGGIAVGPDGALYVTENVGAAGAASVIRIDPASGAQTVLSEGDRLCNPFGLAFEASGDLLVVDYGDLIDASGRTIVNCPIDTGSLVRIDDQGGGQTVLSQGPLFGSPFGVAVEPRGRILVTNEKAVTAGVTAVDPVHGGQTAVTPNVADDVLRFPERIALSPEGDLLLTDFQLNDGNGGIVGVARDGGAQRVLWEGQLFDNPLGIAVVANRPPAAALRATPATVAGRAPVTFDASGSRDPEGQRMRYDWDLDGDGAYEARSSSHTVLRGYETSGALRVGVRVSDLHGATSLASAPLTVDATIPVLDRFGVSGRTLLGRSPRRRTGARAAPRARRAIASGAVAAPPARRSITFSYHVSERARVAIAITRATPERRARGRCRHVRGRARPRRVHCRRWRRVVMLRQLAAAGPNRLRFSGRVRGQRLVPGRYRASAVGLDRVGNRSAPVHAGLRVVAPRR